MSSDGWALDIGSPGAPRLRRLIDQVIWGASNELVRASEASAADDLVALEEWLEAARTSIEKAEGWLESLREVTGD